VAPNEPQYIAPPQPAASVAVSFIGLFELAIVIDDSTTPAANDIGFVTKTAMNF